MASEREAKAKIREWRANPVQYVRDNFKVDPDAWQVRYLTALTTNNRIAAKASKGCGKTTVLAWAAWWFLTCYNDSKVIATSITGDNLRDGLWSEMAKWRERSSLLLAEFEWKAERITANCNKETWYMAARRWSASSDKEQQANSLAGLHADYIMFILDEVGGIPDAVMAAAEAALANAGTEVNPSARAYLLIAGNPTHLSGPLYRACTKEASLWYVIEITGDPDNPERSPRISIQWAREQIQKYGRDNPWVLVNVFGKFPPASFNAIIGPDEVEAAMKRVVREDAYIHSSRILGVDIARQGDDRTVIAPRQGIVAFKPKILRIPDTVQIASVVAQAINSWKPHVVNIDATGGWGYGVIDTLRSWGHTVNDIQFAGKASNFQYFNKRTEMAMLLAEAIRGGLCLPNIPELKEECCAITYYFRKDQIAIVEKELIKEELGRSPDLFDAYGLTYAVPVGAPDYLAPYRNHRPDYDPLAPERGAKEQNLADYNPLA